MRGSRPISWASAPDYYATGPRSLEDAARDAEAVLGIVAAVDARTDYLSDVELDELWGLLVCAADDLRAEDAEDDDDARLLLALIEDAQERWKHRCLLAVSALDAAEETERKRAMGEAREERAAARKRGAAGPDGAPIEVESVGSETKGAARLRKDKRVKRYLSSRRPVDDRERLISYRTEACVGYNEAVEDGAPADVVEFLYQEHEWAAAELGPEFMARLQARCDAIAAAERAAERAAEAPAASGAGLPLFDPAPEWRAPVTVEPVRGMQGSLFGGAR